MRQNVIFIRNVGGQEEKRKKRKADQGSRWRQIRKGVRSMRRMLCSSEQGQQQLESRVEIIRPWEHIKKYRKQQRLNEREQQTPDRAFSRSKSESSSLLYFNKTSIYMFLIQLYFTALPNMYLSLKLFQYCDAIRQGHLIADNIILGTRPNIFACTQFSQGYHATNELRRVDDQVCKLSSSKTGCEPNLSNP